MTSVAEEQVDSATTEPPTKRRRGGRRSTQPEVSAEERKRLRVLKNRESAMRSLAKKAEYSAKLEAQHKEVAAELLTSRTGLEKLMVSSIGLRTALEKVPDDIGQLIARVEAAINRGTSALAEDDDDSEYPGHPERSTVNSPAGNEIDGNDAAATKQ